MTDAAPAVPLVAPVAPAAAPAAAPPAAVPPSAVQGMVPSVRQLAPRLVMSGVLPLVGYALLRPHVGSDAVGLAAVSVFPVVDIAIERRRHGRFDPVGVIALIGLTIGLVSALLLHGDATLLKVRESVFTGVFGLICLGTLAARRPAMWYLGRAFSTGGDAEKVAEFDTMWGLPGVPNRFRFITAVWGVALVAEAVVRTALAVGVSTERFLAISPVLNWGVLGGLLWYTTVFSKKGEQAVLAASPEAQAARDEWTARQAGGA